MRSRRVSTCTATPGLLAEPAPGLQQRNAGLESAAAACWADTRSAPSRAISSSTGFIVDVGRVALRLPDHAVVAQEGSDLPGEIRIDEPDAGAVEAGVADHRKLGLQRPLRWIRPPLSPPIHDLDLV